MNGFLPDQDYITKPLLAPSGTRTPFMMAAPPLGWTQDTTAGLSDCALRVNTSSTGGIAGGSSGWSSWNFGGTVNSANVTLVVANLPVHTHTVNDPTHVASSPGFNLVGTGGVTNLANTGAGQMYQVTSSTDFRASNVVVSNAGSGNPFAIGITAPNVKFNDFLIGVKK